MSTRVHIGACCLLLWLAQPGLLPAQANSDPDIDALDRRVRQFFDGVSADDAPAAYSQLLTGSQLAKQTEALKTLVEKTRELKSKYGDCRNYEQVFAKRVGKDVVVLKYLYQCEHFPIVWHLTFYRSPQRGETTEDANPWRAIIVRFDTDVEALAK